MVLSIVIVKYTITKTESYIHFSVIRILSAKNRQNLFGEGSACFHNGYLVSDLGKSDSSPMKNDVEIGIRMKYDIMYSKKHKRF